MDEIGVNKKVDEIQTQQQKMFAVDGIQRALEGQNLLSIWNGLNCDEKIQVGKALEEHPKTLPSMNTKYDHRNDNPFHHAGGALPQPDKLRTKFNPTGGTVSEMVMVRSPGITTPDEQVTFPNPFKGCSQFESK